MTRAPQYDSKTKPASPSLKKARADLAMALRHATTVLGLSQEGTARVVGVHKRTIGSWLRCEREMNVEAVAASGRLGTTFRRLWCSEGHEPTAPYLARKKARGSK